MSTKVAPYLEPSTVPPVETRVEGQNRQLDTTDPLRDVYLFLSDHYEAMTTLGESARGLLEEWSALLHQVDGCSDTDLKAALRQHGYIHGIAKSEVDDLNALRRTLGSLYLKKKSMNSSPTQGSTNGSIRIRTSFLSSFSSKASAPPSSGSPTMSYKKSLPSSPTSPMLEKKTSSMLFSRQLSIFKSTDDDDDTAVMSNGTVLNSQRGRALRFTNISSLGANEQNVAKSFLPNALISALKGGPLSPRSDAFRGCCMLADISGFTKFSGDMCAQGARGLDKLHRLANEFFHYIVEIVYENNGDVVAFAGDALVCVFPFELGREAQRATEAVRCALQLAQLCTESLTAHIGVSTGEMHFSLLGSDDQFAYLLTGDCILELTSCLDDAKSKQVAITPGVVALFEACASSAEVRLLSRPAREGSGNGNHIVEALVFPDGRDLFETSGTCPDTRIALLNSVHSNKHFSSCAATFIPNPVLKSLKSGSLMFLAELRELTTLFLSLDSFDNSMHKDPQKLQPVFLAFMSALRASGGFLRQFLVDDKGCVFIAFWGVPGSSYNDNAAKAVGCGAALLFDIRALGHRCSIGITTGDVYCGNIGSAVRSDYVGIGAPVNLAARLMGKAHGRLLVCELTHSTLPKAARAALQKAELLHLKGVATATVAYAYAGSGPPTLAKSKSVTHSQTIVLNAHIRKVLQERLLPSELAAAQHTQFTIVVGKGSETLAASYFGRLAEKAGMRHLVFRCSQIRSDPYHVIVQLLLSLCKVDDLTAAGKPAHWRDKVAQAREQLLRLLQEEQAQDLTGAELALAAKSLDLLLGVEEAQEERQEQPPSPVPRRALLRSKDDRLFLRLFMALVRGQHVSIVVQDAHLMDELSWHELSTLCNRPAPAGGRVTVLLTLRVDISCLSENPPTRGVRSLLGSLVSGKQRGAAAEKSSSPASAAAAAPDSSLSAHRSNGSRSNGSRSNGSRSSGRRGSTLGGSSIVTSQVRGKSYSDCDSETFTEGVTHAEGTSVYCPPEGCRCIAASANARVMQMHDLSEEDVYDALLCSLDFAAVSYELATAVFEISKGDPYWCDTIARFMRDNGTDEFLDKFLSVEDSDGYANVLRRLIAYEMERLSPAGQVVIKHCSVVGYEVSLQTLEAVVPAFLREELLSKHLPELVKARFLSCLEASANPIYGFQIEQICRTCYEVMPPTDRQRIHLNVAAHLESLHQADLKPYFPTLHHHYFYCSGMRARCFEYAVKSADFLISKGAYGAGFDYVRHADEIAVSISEHEVLIDVIECALAELHSRNSLSIAGVTASRKSVRNQSELVEVYSSCKQVISSKLEDSKRKVSIGDSGKMPSRLTRMFSVKEQRGALVGKLEWKASFAERQKATRSSKGSVIFGSNNCSLM